MKHITAFFLIALSAIASAQAETKPVRVFLLADSKRDAKAISRRRVIEPDDRSY